MNSHDRRYVVDAFDIGPEAHLASVDNAAPPWIDRVLPTEASPMIRHIDSGRILDISSLRQPHNPVRVSSDRSDRRLRPNFHFKLCANIGSDWSIPKPKDCIS